MPVRSGGRRAGSGRLGGYLGCQVANGHVGPLGSPPQQVEGLGLPTARLGHDDALGLLNHRHGLQPGHQPQVHRPLQQFPVRRGGPPLTPGVCGDLPDSVSLGQHLLGPLPQFYGVGAGSCGLCSGMG